MPWPLVLSVCLPCKVCAGVCVHIALLFQLNKNIIGSVKLYRRSRQIHSCFAYELMLLGTVTACNTNQYHTIFIVYYSDNCFPSKWHAIYCQEFGNCIVIVYINDADND